MARSALAPHATPPDLIRNFCIIAHIDHGKSTLADRMLQITGVVADRDMRAQYLDRMDIERERGITIKSQAVRMPWELGGTAYALDMIDTPGHVDFSYEVSRSLAACEGAILLVDAAQGIEAQTLANLYLALENDLEIIPVLNKIDLPGAEPEKAREQIEQVIGIDASGAIHASAKAGLGIDEILEAIVERVPPPKGDPEGPLRALVFDSWFDQYKGVVVLVHVVDGQLLPGAKVKLMATGGHYEVEHLGVFTPRAERVDRLLDDQVVGPLEPVHERLLVDQAGQPVLVHEVAAELAHGVGDGRAAVGRQVEAIHVAPVLWPLAELERPILELLEGVALDLGALDAGLVEHREIDVDE